MDWNIPRTSGHHLALTIESGESVFILGANGSGKSALIQHLVSSNPYAKIRRISAHRKAWFESGSINLTPHHRRELDQEFTHHEAQQESRWRDSYGDQRQSAVLFDLVAKENALARDIARCVRGQRMEQAATLAYNAASPFDQINELLALGTFAISLQNSNDEEILAKHHDAEATYSMAQLSDGERNATIIAANVLTVPSGTTVLIDEPERHLHRAIVEPFLSALFESRADCAFIISTHEIALPRAFSDARVLMVRSCSWTNNSPAGWDVSVLEPNGGLPENLRRAILGCRHKILFVEGDARSMDLPMYNALYPGLSVVPRGNCVEVKRAVTGLRSTCEHHHVEAFGLIDRDNLTDDEVEALAQQGVFALNVCSVEALYYCSDVIDAVARRQAETMGLDANGVAEAAKECALEHLKDNEFMERMAARRCEHRVRSEILSWMPAWKAIRAQDKPSLHVEISNPYAAELEHIKLLIQRRDLDALVARYPLRESRVFDSVAKSLMFRGRKAYERAALVRVRKDKRLAQALRHRMRTLAVALGWEEAPEAVGR